MNYWIFQSNPLGFPIIQEIRNAFSEKLPVGYQRMNYWHIDLSRLNSKIMSPGNIVFIWKSDGGEKDTRGIYAKAKVFSVETHCKPLTPQRIDAELKKVGLYLRWKNLKAETRNQAYPTVVIEYTNNLIETPLLKNEIEGVLKLKKLVILKSWRRTLYHLTEDQGGILDKKTDF